MLMSELANLPKYAEDTTTTADYHTTSDNY